MAKGWLNLEASEDTIFGGEQSAFSKLGLTKTQRLYGFFGCMALGFILSVLSVLLLFLLGIIPFAALFTVGVTLNLLGTGFVIGFQKQLKTMFDKVRIVATLILIVSIAFAFISAFVLGNSLVCLIMVIVEYLAYLWYSLSYIPYARSLVKSFLPSWAKGSG